MTTGALWVGDAGRLEAACGRMLPELVGVCLHGTAALGGFTSASDLGVLVIADGPISRAVVGQRLLGSSSVPAWRPAPAG